MTVKELIDYLEQLENKDQLVVLHGKRGFIGVAEALTAVLTPGYNWDEDRQQQPAIWLKPKKDWRDK